MSDVDSQGLFHAVGIECFRATNHAWHVSWAKECVANKKVLPGLEPQTFLGTPPTAASAAHLTEPA